MPTSGGPRPLRVPACVLASVVPPGGELRVPDGVDGVDGAARTPLTGVTLNSATVRPGDLYAALPGTRVHGAQFVAQAADAGAVAVLGDAVAARAAALAGLPAVEVGDPRAVLGGIAAAIYGHPADRLTTIGVTGTNGKTTTTFLVDDALRRAGRGTALIGTVETRLLQQRLASARTTPEAPDLHALLAVLLEGGGSHATMEVSSHALVLHRVDGLVFDVAGFTNLSQDHLDFHPTMADYYAAKAQLFTPARSRRAVICVDDAWGRRLAAEASVPVQTVATDGSAADWAVVGRRLVAGRPEVTVLTPAGERVTLHAPLPGDFNVANAVLALALLVATGTEVTAAAAAVAAAGPVPGRMQRVPGPGVPGEPLAIADYAHTPDAIALAARSVRGNGSPLVLVLGAGGDRDREKRPLMGRAAAGAADVVIVTDDNPRSEDPASIRAAVVTGARAAAGPGTEVVEIAGRREALAEAVRRAWGGGTVLVAGKGHEQGQEIGGVVLPFDDREVLAEELRAEAARRDAGHDVVAGRAGGRRGPEVSP